MGWQIIVEYISGKGWIWDVRNEDVSIQKWDDKTFHEHPDDAWMIAQGIMWKLSGMKEPGHETSD